jgi:hypothetical protein
MIVLFNAARIILYLINSNVLIVKYFHVQILTAFKIAVNVINSYARTVLSFAEYARFMYVKTALLNVLIANTLMEIHIHVMNAFLNIIIY